MRAQVLPPVTYPWQAKIERRHNPPRRSGRFGYQQFRPCLRWEFGFTCAFCLCHESDLALHGVETTGLTGVEHFIPFVLEPKLVNEYTNCFYACRFCNLDRGSQANVDPETGGRLLNPCADAWDERFERAGDRLIARQKDRDAAYTHRVYNLDHPRKVEMRRFRRETLQAYLDLLEEGPRSHDRLLDRAIETGDPSLVLEAERLARFMRMAFDFLTRYQLLPHDRQTWCLCGDERLCKVPETLAAQALEIMLPGS